MDLMKTLSQLYAERERIDRIIQALEDLEKRKSPDPPKKRGRKGMDHEARMAVSERMKRYWAARREKNDDMSAPVSMSTIEAGAQN
ncbi:MAG TPA: hypothetical protein VGL72_10690 [Bryobacteraceae bacterium]|jgi:hypothetical protein